MLTNARRRELLDNVRRSGYPGSISEVFQAAQGGRDLVREFEMQQQQQQEMQVANTPEEQEVGLREEHAAGNTDASMAFPNVQPNQSFNTVGMQAPIDIQKIDNQGHLVESYKNVPPGIQDLPTGPAEGTVIESPAAYQTGGEYKHTPYSALKDVKALSPESKNKVAHPFFNEDAKYMYSTGIDENYFKRKIIDSYHDVKHYYDAYVKGNKTKLEEIKKYRKKNPETSIPNRLIALAKKGPLAATMLSSLEAGEGSDIMDPKTGINKYTGEKEYIPFQKGGTRFSMGAEGNVNCLPGVAGCYGYESPLTLKPNFAFTYDTGRKHIGVQGGADLQTYFGGSDTREGAPVLAGGISGGIGTNPTSKELETSKHLSLIGKLGFKRRNLEGAHDWSSFNPGWDAGLYGKYDLLNKQLQDVGVYGSYGALEASLGYNPTQKMLQAGLGLRLGKRQTGGIKKYHEGGYSEHYGQNIDPDAPPHMYEPPHGTPQGDQDNMYTGSNPLYGGNLTDTGANAQYTNFNMLRHRGTHWEVPQWTGFLGNPTAGMSAQRIVRSASKGEEMYGPVGAVGGGIYGMAEPLVKNYATGYLGDVGKKYGKKAAKKFLPKAISRWFQKGGTRKKGGYKGYKQRICKYGCM